MGLPIVLIVSNVSFSENSRTSSHYSINVIKTIRYLSNWRYAGVTMKILTSSTVQTDSYRIISTQSRFIASTIIKRILQRKLVSIAVNKWSHNWSGSCFWTFFPKTCQLFFVLSKIRKRVGHMVSTALPTVNVCFKKKYKHGKWREKYRHTERM